MIHLTLGLSQADREIMDFKLVGITVSDKGKKNCGGESKWVYYEFIEKLCFKLIKLESMLDLRQTLWTKSDNWFSKVGGKCWKWRMKSVV